MPYKNREDKQAYERRYYRTFKRQKYRKEYALLNKEEISLRQAEYYLVNKEKIFQNVKVWKQNNKDKNRLYKAQQRAKRLSATPTWADKDAIKIFYLACPEGYHVDHIIPLQGKHVCGLHTIENLQYLTAKENLNKGNKFLNG